jgi:hypothetical protein
MNLNPMCDGNRCQHSSGEVRVYPLGGGGNLILCRACWDYENGFRAQRARETQAPDNWPQVEWKSSEVYGGAP